MRKFRTKPVIKEAYQFFPPENKMPGSWPPLPPGLCDGACGSWSCNRSRPGIHTLEGTMYVSPGDWVIKGLRGEFYPCKPDIFKETYEPVEETTLQGTLPK